MWILLAVTMLFLFTACSTDESVKVPGTDLIQTDIQNSLSEYHAMQGACALTMQDHQLTKSLTEDKTYTAEYNVTAESKYAQFHYVANISYTMYDQGWSMNSCEWTYVDYKVIRYPCENDLEDLENLQEVEALVNPVFTADANFVLATSLITADWSTYATGSAERITRWTYNSYSDRWDYVDTVIHNNKVQLTDAGIEFLNEALDISNFTETGFDVTFENEVFRADSTFVGIKDDMTFFTEDKIYLRFFSLNDREFYSKNYATGTEKHIEGQIIVSVEIFKDPPMQITANSPYDMVVCYSLVKDEFGVYQSYDFPTYHLVSGEIYQ